MDCMRPGRFTPIQSSSTTPERPPAITHCRPSPRLAERESRLPVSPPTSVERRGRRREQRTSVRICMGGPLQFHPRLRPDHQAAVLLLPVPAPVRPRSHAASPRLSRGLHAMPSLPHSPHPPFPPTPPPPSSPPARPHTTPP